MSAPSHSETHARCGYTGLQSSLIVPVQDTWLQTYAPCSSLPTSSLATSDTSSLIFALEIISQKQGGVRGSSVNTPRSLQISRKQGEAPGGGGGGGGGSAAAGAFLPVFTCSSPSVAVCAQCLRVSARASLFAAEQVQRLKAPGGGLEGGKERGEDKTGARLMLP